MEGQKKKSIQCLRQQKWFPWNLSAKYQCWGQNLWKEPLFLKENQILKRHRVEKAEEEEQGEKVWKRLSGGGSLQLPGAEAERRRERKKKSSSHCAGVDVRATGCDRLGNRSLSHTGDTWRNSPSCRSNVRLTRESGQEGLKPAALFMVTKRIFWLYRQVVKNPPPLLFFSLKVIIFPGNNLALKEQSRGLSHIYLSE